MASTVVSPQVLRSSYRRLYRAGIAAVQNSIPARYDIRDSLRRAFRNTPTTHFSQTRIDNTVDFLLTAARRKGIEHKIIKNLCLIHYWQYNKRKKTRSVLPEEQPYWQALESANNNFLEVIGLLNQSMDLDLR